MARTLRVLHGRCEARGGLRAGSHAYQVELKSYDHESKQDRVQELYTRLITEYKADFLISGSSVVLVNPPGR